MSHPALLSPSSTTECRLCLVRHGETTWNAERRLQGHLDIPLNTVGREQARLSAAQLPADLFNVCYSSDLSRAFETARALCAERNLTPQPLPALRERHYGCFQGLTYDEAAEQHAAAYARFTARDPDYVLPNGGESLRGFQQRILDCIHALAQRHAGETVLIVTHGGVLDIAYRLATGKPLEAPRDFPILNAALNWIAADGPQWRLLSWGEQAHLSAARDELPTT